VYGPAAEGPLFLVLRVLALVFAAPVLVLLGGPILVAAWRGMRTGGANADALIVLGTGGAYALSVANTFAGRPAVYFDTAAMLLVLVTFGRWLEARARAEAGGAVDATLAPAPAAAVRCCGGVREAVPPAALVPDDQVEVGPGDAFPTDGVVVSGVGGVDQAALTGESLPVVKEPGATVAGGTCSVDGLFRVRVTARAAESAAARIAALLAAARRERTPAERTADRAARWLTPGAVVAATAAGAWWTWVAGVDQGVLTALAVLTVACPCALGIATPVAIWRGLVGAAGRGLVVRSAPVLERAAAVSDVLFDKTGTLTAGPPRLVAADPAPRSGLTANALLARAAGLEAGLGHPVARAIADAARARGLTVPVATEVRVAPGRGVRGRVDGVPTTVGSLGLAAEELGTVAVDPAVRDTVVAVVGAGGLLGTLRFAEALRASAPAALAVLRVTGLRTGLLSGDAHAAAVVPGLFPVGEAALGLLPEEKVAHVRRRRARGVVAMVGDGINDAAALAAADVGIAVGNATDLARLAAVFAHARRVRGVIRQNLVWAFGYNLVAVGLAATGRLSPVVAALAMLASSLAVVANAQRLGRAVSPSRRGGRLPGAGSGARRPDPAPPRRSSGNIDHTPAGARRDDPSSAAPAPAGPPVP
jgi:Cu+-exporting ATPase